MRALLGSLLALALAPGLAVLAAPEPAGYRGEPYQAPVPATLEGALVIDDDAAHALWRSGRVGFVDVMPRLPKPEGLPEGTIWRDRPRDTIPGAIWLPNTGYQTLAPEALDYLQAGLAETSGGDKAAPVVIFCRRDCWMSWNAAKRAVEQGYTRVFWYPEGTDGWSAGGRPLEPAEPYAP